MAAAAGLAGSTTIAEIGSSQVTWGAGLSGNLAEQLQKQREVQNWAEGVIVVSRGDHADCLSLEREVGASVPTGAIEYEVSSWNDGATRRKLVPLRRATLKDNIMYWRLSSVRYVRRTQRTENGRYIWKAIRDYFNCTLCVRSGRGHVSRVIDLGHRWLCPTHFQGLPCQF